MAASNSEDRLEVAAMFSVMIQGSRFFPVDFDTDARTSLFPMDSRGGSAEGGGGKGRILLVHTTLNIIHTNCCIYRLGAESCYHDEMST